MGRGRLAFEAAAQFAGVVLFASVGFAAESAKNQAPVEAYIHDPLPPGVQVVGTEVDGPLYADTGGHTLYVWPQQAQRGGDIGDPKDHPSCDDTHYDKSSGAMSPW